MLLLPATLADINYICHIQRIEASREDALGFLPKIVYEREIETGGAIWVAWESGDRVGFVYATHNRAGITTIQQVGVQDDARRLEIGTQLVEEATRPNDWLVKLRCREGLPSVDFWTTQGFEAVALVPSGRRGSVYKFQKIVGGLWLPNPGITKPLGALTPAR